MEEGIVGASAPAKAGAQGEIAQPDSGLLPSQERGRAELAALAEQAARLCKADLVTEMVGEFPELQGIMGGYYARAEDLPDAVADAIRDHYKPVGQGDDVPTAPVTVAVSLADKLDTVASFFAIDERPTGSKDPFALRRAALGILAIIINNDVRVNLTPVLAFAYAQGGLSKNPTDVHALANALNEAMGHVGDEWQKIVESAVSIATKKSHESARQIAADVLEATTQLLDFFADRLKVQQKEAGVRHDLIDAVFALGGEDDLVRLLARVKALQSFVATDDGANLLAGYKRAANILKKEVPDPTSAPANAGAQGEDARSGPGRLPLQEHDALPYTPEPAEAALITALDAAEPRAAQAVADERFEGAMAALATLRAPIDAFFDSVTVNDPDQAKRANRLALLARVRDAVHNVADFSKIAG